MRTFRGWYRARAWIFLQLAVCALCATACLQTATVSCADGIVCPSGSVCDDLHGGCASAAQIAECSQQPELAPCSYPGVTEGACYSGVCLPAGCGNGTVDPPEVCDDGNRLHGDGCSADCMSNETCGNGVIDAANGESCDDGNPVDGDGCQATCAPSSCGDGVIDPLSNEACDDGANNSDTVPDACRTNCQHHFCGDEVVDGDESCDDGNAEPGDGCFYNCKSSETCGNGYVDFSRGEQCDDVDALSHDGCGGCTPELPAWKLSPAGTPAGRTDHVMAYDAARGRVVLFGGTTYNAGTVYVGDTWDWNGIAWSNRTPTAGGPPARADHAMAYDAARATMVMFGGTDGGTRLGDTWAWNGSGWTNRTGGSSPTARSGHAMAYDAARGKVILFGGNIGISVDAADTWEWDGTTWTNVTPAAGNPPARIAHAMAFDAARGRVVMFGGFGGGTRLADTWEWNGTAWTNVTPGAGNPSVRNGHSMAYDATRGKVVMFGGYDGTRLVDTWTWNGTAWTNVTPGSVNPAARDRHAMAFDTVRGKLVLFGGVGTSYFTDTWEWNGTTWADATPAQASPTGRDGTASAYDRARGKVVLFGGFAGGYVNDTWQWNGTGWTNVTPVSGNPPARNRHAMAYDTLRDRVVLFGGQDGTYRGDTWEWNGTTSTWTDVTPASGNPIGRYGAAMAYDAARGRVVMFGGFYYSSGNFYLGDTWEWNGTAWTNVTPAAGSPSVRSGAAMAYDEARGKIVLFGGITSVAYSDTWEWDGSTWTNVTPTTASPPKRVRHAMVYDAARGSVVLYGGSDLGTLADTWEWNGTTWTNLSAAAGSPPARHSHAMSYDVARRTIVMFGGGTLTDTWLYRYQNAESDEACLHRLDGDGDGLIGCADPDCFGYCRPSCSPGVMTCNPAWPHCGDGVCQPIETNQLCPTDCGAMTTICGDFVCQSPETVQSCPGDCSPATGAVAPAVGDLVINEFMAADNVSDTNCDGSTASTQDELIEIVNVSANTLDLRGVTVADAVAVRHTFGTTVLPPGDAVVVWGGGTPNIAGACADAKHNDVATAGLLALNDAGDTITLARGATTLVTVTYGQATINKSQNLSPELAPNSNTAPTNYVPHDSISGAQGAFSPGTRATGMPF